MSYFYEEAIDQEYYADWINANPAGTVYQNDIFSVLHERIKESAKNWLQQLRESF